MRCPLQQAIAVHHRLVRRASVRDGIGEDGGACALHSIVLAVKVSNKQRLKAQDTVVTPSQQVDPRVDFGNARRIDEIPAEILIRQGDVVPPLIPAMAGRVQFIRHRSNPFDAEFGKIAVHQLSLAV